MTVVIPMAPPAPQASDPANFESKADTLLAAWPEIIAAMNAQNAQNNAIADALPDLAIAAVAAAVAAAPETYTHPETHPPSVIAQDANNRFVTDVEKAAWNSKLSPGGLKTINEESIEGIGNIAVSGGGTAGESVIALGTVDQYWRGDKIWSDFAADVRAVLLTGLGAGSSGAISANDSLLGAIAKLQAQITSLEGSGNINVGGTTAVVAKGSVGSGTVTFDVAASSYQTLTVTGGLTLAITGWPTAGTLGELTVEIDNGGSAALTMPTGLRWLKADGTYTTDFTQSGYTLLASGTNFLSFWTRAAGTPVWGRVL